MKKLSITLAYIVSLSYLLGFSNDEWVTLDPILNHWNQSTGPYQFQNFNENENVFLKIDDKIVNAYITAKDATNQSLQVVYNQDKAVITQGSPVHLKPARDEYQIKKASRSLATLYDSQHPSATNNVVLVQRGVDCGLHALWNARAMVRKNVDLMKDQIAFEQYLERARFFLEGTIIIEEKGKITYGKTTNLETSEIYLLRTMKNFFSITQAEQEKEKRKLEIDLGEKRKILVMDGLDEASIKLLFGVGPREALMTPGIEAAQALTDNSKQNVDPIALAVNMGNQATLYGHVATYGQSPSTHWIAIAFYKSNNKIYYQIADSCGKASSYTDVAERILSVITLYSGPGSEPTSFDQKTYPIETNEDKNYLKAPVTDGQWNEAIKMCRDNEKDDQGNPLKNAKGEIIYLETINNGEAPTQEYVENLLAAGKKIFIDIVGIESSTGTASSKPRKRGIIIKTKFYTESDADWVTGEVTITYQHDENTTKEITKKLQSIIGNHDLYRIPTTEQPAG